MYTTIQIELMLTREEMAVPDEDDDDDDDTVQRDKLIQVCRLLRVFNVVHVWVCGCGWVLGSDKLRWK